MGVGFRAWDICAGLGLGAQSRSAVVGVLNPELETPKSLNPKILKNLKFLTKNEAKNPQNPKTRKSPNLTPI